jgi:hypothetical protein
MITTDLHQDLTRRLLYILHLGFVESRLLALAKRDEQAYDLADVMEVLPSLLSHGEDDARETMDRLLREYKGKYPDSTYDYAKYLDWHPIPKEY